MHQSDSEDFESADEGSHEGTFEKSERKKRISSSNFSDTANERENVAQQPSIKDEPSDLDNKTEQQADGWDDFDIEEPEPAPTKEIPTKPLELLKQSTVSKKSETQKDTGWDDFDDWGQEESTMEPQKFQPQTSTMKEQPDIKSIADRLAATTVTEKSGGGWGWGGWGVDSLLSTATAGISTITNHVSQGLTTVLETGIGAPDPEELARQSSQARGAAETVKSQESNTTTEDVQSNSARGADDAAFQFGSLISGVTKFVESTGTKVIAGGLDTLETIGKKTMEVLQDGDPGLVKKRAMLGLDAGDKPVLSQVLREAKLKADEEDRIKEEKREAKEVHYETLFDDYEGLVHLEALEMLSKQVNMRIEERLRTADPDKKQEIKETLQQVSELCEMPDDDDEDDEENTSEGFHERLQEATQDLGLKLHFQPLVKHYTDTLDWIAKTEEAITEKAVFKYAVSSLAQYTALSVELYHKAGEMLLVKTRRSTADEADAMTQMTVVLTKHISEMATCFTGKLNSITTGNKEQISNYITNVFLEAGNSSTYIQNAFQLALPILQIGAV